MTVEGSIGNIKLSQLTTGSVIEFRDRLLEAGVTVVTTRKILSTLQQSLSHAVDRDRVGTNVAVIGRRDEGVRKTVPPAINIRKPKAEPTGTDTSSDQKS